MMKKYLAILAIVFTGAAYSINAATPAPEVVEAEVMTPEETPVLQQKPEQVQTLANELMAALRAQGLTTQDILDLILTVDHLKKKKLIDKEIVSVLENAITSKKFSKSNTKLYLSIASIAVAAFVLGVVATLYPPSLPFRLTK